MTLLVSLEFGFNYLYIFAQQAEMIPCSGTSHLSRGVFLLPAIVT